MIDVDRYLAILDQFPNLKSTVEKTIEIEGGFVDNPDDPGGATNYGVTLRTARRNGYRGDMRNLPIDFARAVYVQDYVFDPGFNKIMDVGHLIAEELIDTGVNTGPEKPIKWLQRALNTCNQKGSVYSDLSVDGLIGNRTLNALEYYLDYRSDDGVEIMIRMLDCQQGDYYLGLASGNDRYETFVYGWFRNRIGNVSV